MLRETRLRNLLPLHINPMTNGDQDGTEWGRLSHIFVPAFEGGTPNAKIYAGLLGLGDHVAHGFAARRLDIRLGDTEVDLEVRHARVLDGLLPSGKLLGEGASISLVQGADVRQDLVDPNIVVGCTHRGHADAAGQAIRVELLQNAGAFDLGLADGYTVPPTQNIVLDVDVAGAPDQPMVSTCRPRRQQQQQ